jgi:hypothetical protein
MRAKRPALPLYARGGTLQFFLWISYEIATCEPKNDFDKKL